MHPPHHEVRKRVLGVELDAPLGMLAGQSTVSTLIARKALEGNLEMRSRQRGVRAGKSRLELDRAAKVLAGGFDVAGGEAVQVLQTQVVTGPGGKLFRVHDLRALCLVIGDLQFHCGNHPVLDLFAQGANVARVAFIALRPHHGPAAEVGKFNRQACAIARGSRSAGEAIAHAQFIAYLLRV